MGCSQSASKPVQRPVDAAAPVPAPATATAAAPSAAPSQTAIAESAPSAAGVAALASSVQPASACAADSGQPVAVAASVQHRPLIICGPSGVGKGTLLTRLLSEYPHAFAKSVSHTTRAPRAGEVDGVSYHFTTADALLASVAAGKFVEHANVHGNYYGTSVAAVADVMNSGRLCLLEIDIQGVLAVRKVDSLQPRCVFIRPPTFGDLADRLAARGSESDDTTQKRLDTARAEMDFFYTHRHIFDADLVNDDLEATYDRLRHTIKNLYPQLNMDKPTTNGTQA